MYTQQYQAGICVDTQPQSVVLAVKKKKDIDLTFCLGVERNGYQGDQAVNKYKVVRALRKNKTQVRGWKDEVVQGESAILRHHNEEKHL